MWILYIIIISSTGNPSTSMSTFSSKDKCLSAYKDIYGTTIVASGAEEISIRGICVEQ